MKQLKFKLSGKRVKMRLNKHNVTVIDSPPQHNMLTREEGEKRLRKILLA